MCEITFEELREEHIGSALEIYNYYVRTSTATFHLHEITENEMRGLVIFRNPKYKAFVILSGGELCGYAYVGEFKSREAYGLTAGVTIYLAPGHTDRGYGAKTIAHLEEFSRAQGFHALIAGICAENAASIALFEKCGYVKCAHYREVGRKFGRVLDTVAYEKILG